MYTAQVDIPFGSLNLVLKWCRHNLTQEWAYDIKEPSGERAGEFEFQFTNEGDYVKFVLWQQ